MPAIVRGFQNPTPVNVNNPKALIDVALVTQAPDAGQKIQGYNLCRAAEARRAIRGTVN